MRTSLEEVTEHLVLRLLTVVVLEEELQLAALDGMHLLEVLISFLQSHHLVIMRCYFDNSNLVGELWHNNFLVTLGVLLGLGHTLKEVPGSAKGQPLDGYKPGPLLWASQLESEEPDPLEILLVVLLAQVQPSLLAIMKIEVTVDCHLKIEVTVDCHFLVFFICGELGFVLPDELGRVVGKARSLLFVGRVEDKDQVHFVVHLVAGCLHVHLTLDLDWEGLLSNTLMLVGEQAIDSSVGIVLTF